jgi:hypothetical protein
VPTLGEALMATLAVLPTLGAVAEILPILLSMLAANLAGAEVMLAPAMAPAMVVVVVHAECEYLPTEATERADSIKSCNEEGHFARECPQKPEGGGLTGECFNCGEIG